GISRSNRVSEFVRSLPKRREDAIPLCVGRPLGDDKFQPTFTRRTSFARVGSLEREALLHVVRLSDSDWGQGKHGNNPTRDHSLLHLPLLLSVNERPQFRLAVKGFGCCRP